MKALLLLLLALPAYAAPVATATSEGAVITLTDEPCALTAEVSNLPARATWTDKGQTWEGCYNVHPQGIVILYFSDKTVAIAPRTAFQKATGV